MSAGHEAASIARSLRAAAELAMANGEKEIVLRGGLPARERASPRPPAAVFPSFSPSFLGGKGRPRAAARRSPPPAPAPQPACSPSPSFGPPPPPAPAPAPASAPPAGARADLLARRARELASCTLCALSKGRRQVVYGTGNPEARLMFVGEGPGAEEDRLGEPFVGRAGELLDRIIAAMGLRRKDVYIANVVKCRPPENRVPMFDEVNACFPFLREQIDIVRPEVIVALGATAVCALLRKAASVSSLRGRWHAFAGIPLLATYHPAYLLRNPADKKKVWEDMQIVMRKLGLERPKSGKLSL